MEFQKDKYSNPVDALKSIDKSYNKMQGEFISLGTEYANKITGSFGNDVFYLFRDNILRRIGAALFHYDILAKMNISGFPISYDLQKFPPDGFYVGLHQSYVFDSIIFHLVSGFDYYSSFIKYLTYGHRDNKREVWSKLVKRLPHLHKLSATRLGKEIIAIDQEFVKDLCDYRAFLIHNESDFPRFNQSTNLGKSETIITVTSPKYFHKKFKEHLPPIEDSSLNVIALWMLDSTVEALQRLLNATSSYFEDNRLTSPKDDIIVFGPPKSKK